MHEILKILCYFNICANPAEDVSRFVMSLKNRNCSLPTYRKKPFKILWPQYVKDNGLALTECLQHGSHCAKCFYVTNFILLTVLMSLVLLLIPTLQRRNQKLSNRRQLAQDFPRRNCQGGFISSGSETRSYSITQPYYLHEEVERQWSLIILSTQQPLTVYSCIDEMYI